MSPNNKQDKKTLKNDEKTVNECKKSHNLIKSVAGRKITIISKQEYGNVRIEYV